MLVCEWYLMQDLSCHQIWDMAALLHLDVIPIVLALQIADVQVLDMDLNSRGAKEDSGLLSRPELEQMITWETNNLYEYLKELYDHKHEDMLDDRCIAKTFSLHLLCHMSLTTLISAAAAAKTLFSHCHIL